MIALSRSVSRNSVVALLFKMFLFCASSCVQKVLSPKKRVKEPRVLKVVAEKFQKQEEKSVGIC
jgi:hypothetical protein